MIQAPTLTADQTQGMKFDVGPIEAKWLQFGDLCRISITDGSIEMLPGFSTHDEAAKEFWNAVKQMAPSFPEVVKAA